MRRWRARLREAAAIGAITDLHALADTLLSETRWMLRWAGGSARSPPALISTACASSRLRSKAQDAAMHAEGSSPPPSTILVVDDSATNLQVLVRTLQGSGHRILAAKDGPTALDIAKRTQPDLMLLDVMMPGMDGFEVCRELKAQPETRDTMVIFLSARGEVADKVSGLELGAIDYITKPIQGEEVLARVAVHLSRQHLERELRQSRDRLDKELAGAARMQQLLLPPTMPPHPAIQFRQLLPDQPSRRRRLLRRAAARRRSPRHARRRCLGPRRAARRSSWR